ncbi:MAG: substrate-binding domain-containing protein [Solirubrobacteraceae bacterium]
MFSARLSYAVTDPAAIALLQGLTEATEAKGYELLLLPGQRGTGVEVESVREAVVGAFCLYCMPDDHPALKAALDRRLPVVVVDEPRLPGTFFIGIEDRAGARAAAEHLRALGHEHVAVIVDRLRDDRTGDRIIDGARIADGYYRVSRERIAGYFEGLGGAVTVYETIENEPAAGGRGAEALLALSPRPTALLCASDQLALGAIEVIRAAGLEVPGDVAVIGYDDVPDAARAGLTTVHQPLLEKGREAGRLLLEPNTEREVILPVELVVRGSTDPAAA